MEKKREHKKCGCGDPACERAGEWVNELIDWIIAHGKEEIDWVEDEPTVDYFLRRYGAPKEVIESVIGGSLEEMGKVRHPGALMNLINFGIQLEGRRNHQLKLKNELEGFLGKEKFEQLKRLLPTATSNAEDNEYEHLS